MALLLGGSVPYSDPLFCTKFENPLFSMMKKVRTMIPLVLFSRSKRMFRGIYTKSRNRLKWLHSCGSQRKSKGTIYKSARDMFGPVNTNALWQRLFCSPWLVPWGWSQSGFQSACVVCLLCGKILVIKTLPLEASKRELHHKLFHRCYFFKPARQDIADLWLINIHSRCGQSY